MQGSGAKTVDTAVAVPHFLQKVDASTTILQKFM